MESGSPGRQTLSLEVEQMKLLLEYEGQEHDRAAMEERDRIIANLLLGKMMVDPPFSYKGEGEGTPIETRSSVMIASLAEAFSAVNSPEEDAIFQVTVRRGCLLTLSRSRERPLNSTPSGGNKRNIRRCRRRNSQLRWHGIRRGVRCWCRR